MLIIACIMNGKIGKDNKRKLMEVLYMPLAALGMVMLKQAGIGLGIVYGLKIANELFLK